MLFIFIQVYAYRFDSVGMVMHTKSGCRVPTKSLSSKSLLKNNGDRVDGL